MSKAAIFFGQLNKYRYVANAGGVTLTGYNLRAAALAAGWNGIVPLEAIVTVNSSMAAGSLYPAFVIDGVYPYLSTISVIVNAGIYIAGGGGEGGFAGGYGGSQAGDGGVGGTALKIVAGTGADIFVTNNGTIAGGSGGGGGGGMGSLTVGGGGAGGGCAFGSKTAKILGGYGCTNGTDGTLLAGGIGGFGGVSGIIYGGAGGNGGATLATNGTAGTSGSAGLGGAGGVAGAATDGAANATWLVTGTRLGTIG